LKSGIVQTVFASLALSALTSITIAQDAVDGDMEADKAQLLKLMRAAQNFHPQDELEVILTDEIFAWRRRFLSRECSADQVVYAQTNVVVFDQVELKPRRSEIDTTLFDNPDIRISRFDFTIVASDALSESIGDFLSKVDSPNAKSASYTETCDGVIKRLESLSSYRIYLRTVQAEEFEELMKKYMTSGA